MVRQAGLSSPLLSGCATSGFTDGCHSPRKGHFRVAGVCVCVGGWGGGGGGGGGGVDSPHSLCCRTRLRRQPRQRRRHTSRSSCRRKGGTQRRCACQSPAGWRSLQHRAGWQRGDTPATAPPQQQPVHTRRRSTSDSTPRPCVTSTHLPPMAARMPRPDRFQGAFVAGSRSSVVTSTCQVSNGRRRPKGIRGACGQACGAQRLLGTRVQGNVGGSAGAAHRRAGQGGGGRAGCQECRQRMQRCP